jgi:hypothetical protein
MFGDIKSSRIKTFTEWSEHSAHTSEMPCLRRTGIVLKQRLMWTYLHKTKTSSCRKLSPTTITTKLRPPTSVFNWKW